MYHVEREGSYTSECALMHASVMDYNVVHNLTCPIQSGWPFDQWIQQV